MKVVSPFPRAQCQIAQCQIALCQIAQCQIALAAPRATGPVT